jgi:hypothetical protein
MLTWLAWFLNFKADMSMREKIYQFLLASLKELNNFNCCFKAVSKCLVCLSFSVIAGFIQSAYGTFFRITAGFGTFFRVKGGHLKPGISYLKRVLERIRIITIVRKTYFLFSP